MMKTKKQRVISLLIAVILMLGSLSACSGSKDNQTDSSTTPESQSQEGSEESGESGETTEDGNTEQGDLDLSDEQVLNLTFTDLALLDVNDVRNSNEFQILSQVQEGLFRTFTDEDGNDVIENAGCESYTISDDGLTYTFTIRDQKWSDGEAVVAQHYVDSVKRLLNPDNGFAYAELAFGIKNGAAYYEGEATADDVGVEAPDDKTFVITLEEEIPYFIKMLTNVCFYPVRLDVIEAGGDTYGNDYTKHVYNGPFIISDRVLENSMTLTKNENYWDADNVYLETVNFTVVAQTSTQSLLIESQELDAALGTAEYVDYWQTLVDSGQLYRISQVSPTVSYLCFNQHTGGPSGLMNNEKIRLALSLALDREEINELIYEGINTPAYSLIPYGILVGDEEFRAYTGVEPLKALADEYTGNTEALSQMFLEGLEEETDGQDASAVNLTLITYSSTEQSTAFNEYIKQTWESTFGITVTLNVLADSSLFVEERNNNRYDFVSMGWGGDYNDPMTFFELWYTGSGYSRFMGGYSNEEFDRLYTELKSVSDNKERAVIYKELEENLVSENAGIAPLYFSNEQIFVQSYVKNLSTPSFGTQYEFSRAYISGK